MHKQSVEQHPTIAQNHDILTKNRKLEFFNSHIQTEIISSNQIKFIKFINSGSELLLQTLLDPIGSLDIGKMSKCMYVCMFQNL